MVNSPWFCCGRSCGAYKELVPTSVLNGELSVDGGALLRGLIGAVVVVGRWVVIVVVVVVLRGVVVVGLLVVVVVTGTLVVVGRVGYPLVGAGG